MNLCCCGKSHTNRLIWCSGCERHHLIGSLLPDPDRPSAYLCPVAFKGAMRLRSTERAESEQLLREAFGTDSDEFPEWWTG